MKKTLRGPQGLVLELDTDEINLDDPGMGTPAIVTVGDENGTYWAALETGELCCGRGVYTLTSAQQRWIEQQQQVVADFLGYPEDLD